MIIYALIVRSKDALPLSASTDFNDTTNKSIKESKKYVKMVAGKALQFPERCFLHLTDYSIFMATYQSVSYLVMCNTSYPTVLAFSFLNVLMKEFVTRYEVSRVNLSGRPYPFIEFDSVIHKLCQQYNKPQALSSRINLATLNTEMKLRPPYQLCITDVEPLRNGYKYQNVPQLGIGPPPKLENLVWYAKLSVVPTIFLIIIGFYRGFSSLHVSSLEVYDGPSPTHGLIFLVEALLRVGQVYLLLAYSKYRIMESWICIVALALCEFCVWDLRDTFVQVGFLTCALLIHVCTVTRKLQLKLPDYNV